MMIMDDNGKHVIMEMLHNELSLSIYWHINIMYLFYICTTKDTSYLESSFTSCARNSLIRRPYGMRPLLS